MGVMTKLTVVLLAAIFCIILADVSGEQSTETDILPEKLSDKNLVKREADPSKKKKKKTGKKKCQRGKKGKKCRREKKRRSGKKSKKRGGKSQGGKKGKDLPRRGELMERKSAQRVKREKIVEIQKN